jgi:hypothetical protein
MTTGSVDPDLLTWVSRWWGKKAGQIVTEMGVGHCRGGAPATVSIIPKERLEGFKDSRELCQDLEEIMVEHARNYPGRVRFEICMWSGTRVIASKQIEKRGEGEPIPEEGGTQTAAQTHRTLELAISTLQRSNESLERRIQRYEDLIDRLYAKYPELLDLMEGLADRGVEREVKRRQLTRIEDLKDKAGNTLFKYGPHLLAKLTHGTAVEDETKLLVAAPHLKAIVKSLWDDDNRSAQILTLMTEDERRHFLALAQAYAADEKKDEQAKTEDPKIAVKAQEAVPPVNGASGQ